MTFDLIIDFWVRLRGMEGIQICGKPEACVVAVESEEFDIYRLSDAMAKKGWSLNALQFPSRWATTWSALNDFEFILTSDMIFFSRMIVSIHLCVTYLHTAEGVAERFVDDVREIVAEIRLNPKAVTAGSVELFGFFLFWSYPRINCWLPILQAAIYGMSQSIPDRSMVGEIASMFLETIYTVKSKSQWSDLWWPYYKIPFHNWYFTCYTVEFWKFLKQLKKI